MYVISGSVAPEPPQYTVKIVPRTVVSVSISMNRILSKQMVLAPDFKQIRLGFSHINIIGKCILSLQGSETQYQSWFSE